MDEPKKKSRSLVSAAVLVAGGVGLLRVARDRFQHRQLFVPDRFPNGVWNPAAFGLPAEDVWFRSEDGEELHGWWIPHRRARGTVLYCHGNTGSLAHQIGDLRYLRRLGVNLFAFDYRGYGRSTGKPTEEGLYRDVRAAYGYLRQTVGIGWRQILLFGHSLGGAVAIDAATECPAAGLVAQATFTDVRDAARGIFPSLPVHLAARRQFRSIDKVGRLELPVLFVHGEEDGTLPPELGRRLHEAAAEPKGLYLIPNAGHNDLHRHGGWRYLRRLSRFRTRCIKTAQGRQRPLWLSPSAAESPGG